MRGYTQSSASLRPREGPADRRTYKDNFGATTGSFDEPQLECLPEAATEGDVGGVRIVERCRAKLL